MPNILIVEDEEAIRRVLKKVLTEDDNKNKIIEASDGVEAINKIKSENKIQIEINGDLFNCSVIKEPLYDPSGQKMRS